MALGSRNSRSPGHYGVKNSRSSLRNVRLVRGVRAGATGGSNPQPKYMIEKSEIIKICDQKMTKFYSGKKTFFHLWTKFFYILFIVLC
jgi:hypothetical protein